jgi:pyruvate dehydrogenase E2 component (dihydrolipoamide acetyltransferase)
VNARRAGNRILYFDQVDVGATVEREADGRVVLDVATLKDADTMSGSQITRLLHDAKYGPPPTHESSAFTAALIRLPGPLRRTAI